MCSNGSQVPRFARRLVISLAAVALTAAAAVGAPYTVIEIPTLGGTLSRAYKVNNAGTVVGEAMVPGSQLHAFIYQNGVMTDLGTLGGADSVARGINQFGDVTGEMDVSTFDIKGFVHSNGVTTQMPTLGGVLSRGMDINDYGQVTGESGLRKLTGQPNIVHAFRYENGTMTDLGSLGGEYSIGSGINNYGQVCGYSYLPGSSVYHAFRYSAGVMTDLGTLGGTYSLADGINDLGHVVGQARIASGASHPFIWQNGVMTDLGGGPGRAYDINNANQVVGSSAGGATLWDNGTIVNLNTVIPAGSGWVLNTAYGISENGRIVGVGTYNGQTRGFLLLPEPGTVVLLLLGTSVCLIRRRSTAG